MSSININNNLSYEEYLDILNSGRIHCLCRIEFLRDEDESVRSQIVKLPLSGSQLTCDVSSGARRSLSLVLDNSNKDFIPSINTIWIQTKFQLYLGYQHIDGRQIWFPQGVYIISNPELKSNYSEKTVSFKCDDKWNGLLNIPVGKVYIIPAGTSVIQAVSSILKLVGDKKEPIIESLPDICPYDMRWSESTTYATIIKDLSNLYSREVFYDVTGHLKLQKFASQDTAETIFEFKTNTTHCQYMGATRVLKFSEVYNHIYVVGGTMDSSTFSGEAVNDDLTSLTRRELIGDKAMPPITDSKIYSNNLCQQRAEFELNLRKRIQESISLNCIPLFHCDVNKAIAVTDDSIALNRTRYVIQQFQMPLDGKSNMTTSGLLYSDSSDFMDRTSQNTITN